MSQAVKERKSGQNLPIVRKRQPLPVPPDHGLEMALRSKREETDVAAPVEHPTERKTRLDELVENGKQRRWKETTFIKAFLAFGFLISVVWAIVVLSGQFSPAVQQQVTDVIKGVLCAVAGFIAGKGADKWFG